VSGHSWLILTNPWLPLPTIPMTTIVIRAAALVKRMSSTPAGLPIPWDDWKGDGMIMEETDYIRPFVLGTRVLFGKGEFDFEVCDFSLWGCRSLRLEDGGEGEGVIPSANIWSPKAAIFGSDDMRTLGDSLVMSMVGDSLPNVRCAYLFAFGVERTMRTPSAVYASGSYPSCVPSGLRILGPNKQPRVTGGSSMTRSH